MSTFQQILTNPKVENPLGVDEMKCKLFKGSSSFFSETPSKAYENSVFTFLHHNREKLGIKNVFRYENCSVDARIEFEDGSVYDVEAKYRMNWLKACQANWQFFHLMDERNEKFGKCTGGIVFFQEFNGDWAKNAGKEKFPVGWKHWFSDHSTIRNLPITLINFDTALSPLKHFNGREVVEFVV